MNRQYYLIEVPHADEPCSLDVCIGNNSTQRYSLDGSLLIVKTTQYLIDSEVTKGVDLPKIFPPGLTTSKTYEEIREIVQTPEWDDLNF